MTVLLRTLATLSVISHFITYSLEWRGQKIWLWMHGRKCYYWLSLIQGSVISISNSRNLVWGWKDYSIFYCGVCVLEAYLLPTINYFLVATLNRDCNRYETIWNVWNAWRIYFLNFKYLYFETFTLKNAEWKKNIYLHKLLVICWQDSCVF